MAPCASIQITQSPSAPPIMYAALVATMASRPTPCPGLQHAIAPCLRPSAMGSAWMGVCLAPLLALENAIFPDHQDVLKGLSRAAFQDSNTGRRPTSALMPKVTSRAVSRHLSLQLYLADVPRDAIGGGCRVPLPNHLLELGEKRAPHGRDCSNILGARKTICEEGTCSPMRTRLDQK